MTGVVARKLKAAQSSVFRKNPQMISRKIDDETILVPIFRTSKELNYIYSLNECAAKVWEMMDNCSTVAELKSKASQIFEAESAELEKRLSYLLKDLRQIKALI